MNTCMWSWWSPKWDLSKSWDKVQWCRYMSTIGMKMVREPKNCDQGVSGPQIIWSMKKIEKSHCHLAQVYHHEQVGPWRPSCGSCKSWRGHIHPKFLISHLFRACYRNPKLNWKFFYFLSIIFLKMLFEIWDLWNNLRARSGHPSQWVEYFSDHGRYHKMAWAHHT